MLERNVSTLPTSLSHPIGRARAIYNEDKEQIFHQSQDEEATAAAGGQAEERYSEAASEEERATTVVAAEDSGPARAVRPTPAHGIMPGRSRGGEDLNTCMIS